MVDQRKASPKDSGPAHALAPYCDHGQLASGCEDCAWNRRAERNEDLAETSGRAPRVATSKPGPVAGEDMVIVRSDLFSHDPEIRPLTLVRKGEVIPPELVHLERQA